MGRQPGLLGRTLAASLPIVGGLKDDRIKVGGKTYPLSRHGFARGSTFELIEAPPSRCLWCCARATRRARITRSRSGSTSPHAIEADRPTQSATVVNEVDGPMPASFGFHPAFRWPLQPDLPRERYEVRIENPEPAPIRRLSDGLLGKAVLSPVQGDRLPLADALFTHDALIRDRPQSRSQPYGGPSGPSLRLDFPQIPHLGIWTKPGAGLRLPGAVAGLRQPGRLRW